MPSTLVNETLQGISQGVSQQFTEARRESQVEEMINCIPSISRGILRRNPTEYIVKANPDFAGPDRILTTTEPFIYSYDRGVGTEQYMIIIGEEGKWKVLNTTTGALLSEGTDSAYLAINPLNKTPREIYRAITVVDTTFIVNTEVEVAMTATVDGITNSHLGTGVYWIKRTSQVVTHTENVSGVTGQRLEGYIYELLSGGTQASVQATKDTQPSGDGTDKLQGDQIASQIATDLGGLNYKSSGPIIYNKNLSIEPQDIWEWADSFGNEASYGFKGQVRSTDLLPDKMPSDLIDTVVRVTGVTDDTIDDYWMKYTGATWTETREPGLQNSLDATTMPHVFRRESNGIFTFGYYGKYDSDLVINEDSGFITTATEYYRKEDLAPGTDTGFFQTASEYYIYKEPPEGGAPPSPAANFYFIYYNDIIQVASRYPLVIDTPYIGEDGNTYYINEASPVDGVHYDIRRINAGDGLYKIYYGGILKLSSPTYFTPNTNYLASDDYYYQVDTANPIPDTDYNVRRLNYFEPGYNPSIWDNRLVGDNESALNPSFVGKQLTDVFFYKNRLGLLTTEDVILSELSTYSNFWSTSVRFVPSDDPIDIAIADTSITTLTAAVPTQFSLMLMSDEAQYILDSDGPLTPSSVYVETATKYNYSRKAKARAIGNEIKFISTSGNYDQLFTYRLSEATDKPTEAEQLTAHIPSYIPTGIHTIIGHSVLGYTFLLANNQLYVHNQLLVEGKAVQSAFHKWSIDKNIYGITIIDNSLFILDSDYRILKISLEIPGNISDTVYADWNSLYSSSIHFSKWTVRDANNLGNLRGRLQIRTLQYSVSDDSRYETLVTNTDRREPVDYESTWVVATGIYLAQNSLGEDTIWTADDIYIGDKQFIVRQYIDDSKITVAGAAKHTEIIFKENPDYPIGGFELATINYEGLFTQRSRRI